ncbi:hypothetical protein V2G26_015536 [Clonostachys chloroleuca]
MIGSYIAHDSVSDKPILLGVPQQGRTLEVVNSRIALVVNKHRIILLSLLGRYGKRSDGGTDSGSDEERIPLRRTAYGEWILDKKAQLALHGVTGTIKGLWRHKGSWSYMTSIWFVSHAARKIFPRSTQTKRESSSMQRLF